MLNSDNLEILSLAKDDKRIFQLREKVYLTKKNFDVALDQLILCLVQRYSEQKRVAEDQNGEENALYDATTADTMINQETSFLSKILENLRSLHSQLHKEEQEKQKLYNENQTLKSENCILKNKLQDLGITFTESSSIEREYHPITQKQRTISYINHPNEDNNPPNIQISTATDQAPDNQKLLLDNVSADKIALEGELVQREVNARKRGESSGYGGIVGGMKEVKRGEYVWEENEDDQGESIAQEYLLHNYYRDNPSDHAHIASFDSTINHPRANSSFLEKRKLALSRSEAKYINLGESIQIPTTTKRGLVSKEGGESKPQKASQTPPTTCTKSIHENPRTNKTTPDLESFSPSTDFFQDLHQFYEQIESIIVEKKKKMKAVSGSKDFRHLQIKSKQLEHELQNRDRSIRGKEIQINHLENMIKKKQKELETMEDSFNRKTRNSKFIIESVIPKLSNSQPIKSTNNTNEKKDTTNIRKNINNLSNKKMKNSRNKSLHHCTIQENRKLFHKLKSPSGIPNSMISKTYETATKSPTSTKSLVENSNPISKYFVGNKIIRGEFSNLRTIQPKFFLKGFSKL